MNGEQSLSSLGMTSLYKWASRLLGRAPHARLEFPKTGFEVVSSDLILDEERFDTFEKGLYYPVKIGDVYNSRYQVVGKLGYGTTSTAWLAQDLQQRRHVTLKIFTRGDDYPQELEACRIVQRANRSHPGYSHVRGSLESFRIPHLSNSHFCLVQKPMWDSLIDLLLRNPTHRLSVELLKMSLVQIFVALDFLHTECKLIHTDIKGENILQEIADEEILHTFTQSELEDPSPRKFFGDTTIYASRGFCKPKDYGRVVLSDLGSAVSGLTERDHDVQPDVLRAPEVMIQAKWSYPIDIWNVGVMIWELFEDKHMFDGQDPDGEGYSTRAHLAEVIGMLGPAPVEFLKRGTRSSEFFTEEGKWKADVNIVPTSLAESEENLVGDDKVDFLKFMGGMIQWRPEDRKTAEEMFKDPWLKPYND